MPIETKERFSITIRTLLTVAALIVVIAGMRAARELIVPLMFALFIVIIFMPVLSWLRRKGVSNLLSVILILTTLLLIGTVITTFVGMSVNSFMKDLPEYQSRMDTKTLSLFDWLRNKNINVSAQGVLDYVTPNKALTLTESLVSGLSILLGNGLLILFTVGFIMIEASSFPRKLRSAISKPEPVLDDLKKFSKAAQRYMLNKSITSATTGLLIWAFLTIIGVDYPVLWGLLACLLNFVPYIGVVLATVPPVLLSLIQLGVGPAIWALAGCALINTTVAIVEPRLLAGGVGLSGLVVFLSLVFWGWILGPIGAVLSVPLTIIVKIALESHNDSRWFALMLGSVPLALVPSKTVPANAVRSNAVPVAGHKSNESMPTYELPVPEELTKNKENEDSEEYESQSEFHLNQR